MTRREFTCRGPLVELAFPEVAVYRLGTDVALQPNRPGFVKLYAWENQPHRIG